VRALAPGTLYQSRILCYYTQQNDGVLYTDYTPDEITTASFTTTPVPDTNIRGRAVSRGPVVVK
jgi:hypothetical protein